MVLSVHTTGPTVATPRWLAQGALEVGPQLLPCPWICHLALSICLTLIPPGSRSQPADSLCRVH